MKKVLKEVLFWTWCLPQTLVGLFVKLFYKATNRYRINKNPEIYISGTMPGAISLGKYIIVGKLYDTDYTVKHEYGHQIQSFILGPLYLLVIGLPSIIWCWWIHPLTKKSYYWFYTEKWANKLGGINE